MALAIDDGVLYDNNDVWVDYYVLNDVATQVYLITLDADGVLVSTESDEPEDNPQIKDETTDIKYFLALTDGVLWLDNGEDVCTMAVLCARINELKTITLALSVSEEKQTEEIIELQNGWKAIY